MYGDKVFLGGFFAMYNEWVKGYLPVGLLVQEWFKLYWCFSHFAKSISFWQLKLGKKLFLFSKINLIRNYVLKILTIPYPIAVTSADLGEA